MADPSVVAEKLRGYRDSLMAQRLAIAGAFHHLTVAYAQLKSVWRGEGARQFEVEWARVEAAFDTYAERISPLIELLDHRIDVLRELDRGMS